MQSLRFSRARLGFSVFVLVHEKPPVVGRGNNWSLVFQIGNCRTVKRILITIFFFVEDVSELWLIEPFEVHCGYDVLLAKFKCWRGCPVNKPFYPTTAEGSRSSEKRQDLTFRIHRLVVKGLFVWRKPELDSLLISVRVVMFNHCDALFE